MTVLDALSTLSIVVIALVCAMTIIKYHRELGLLITVAILFLALSCVGLVFDTSTGRHGIWAMPMFHVVAAAASATIYLKLRAFWTKYGIFIRALNQSTKDKIA